MFTPKMNCWPEVTQKKLAFDEVCQYPDHVKVLKNRDALNSKRKCHKHESKLIIVVIKNQLMLISIILKYFIFGSLQYICL